MANAARVIMSAMAGIGLLLFAGTAYAQDTDCRNRPFCIGDAIPADIYAAWNITILPDGANLPDGQGNAATGAGVYHDHCESCHGPGGRGGIKVDPDHAAYPALVSGADATPLTSSDSWPTKTIGTYWPYATSVFDYVHRAMPLTDAQSLSSDETYAVVAYLLAENRIIPRDQVMDRDTLAAVVMPNRDGFICDARPDVANPRCMENCSIPGERTFPLDVSTGRPPSDENCLIFLGK